MLAAEFVDAEKINFMGREAAGLLYLAISEEQQKKLKLPLMRSDVHASSRHHAAFTFSIEASSGVGTGISAADRAHTIKIAIRSNAVSADVVCPGHVFPIVARDGGVLVREGHTEAAVDLARLCGLNPSTVACEILDDKGASANRAYLSEFSAKYNIKIGTVADLINYRKSLNEFKK